MIELDSDPTKFLRADGTWATPDIGVLTILTIMFGSVVVAMLGLFIVYKIREYRMAKFTPQFQPRIEQATLGGRPLMSAEQYLVREFDRVHTHNRMLVRKLDDERERMKVIQTHFRDPDEEGAQLIRIAMDLKRLFGVVTEGNQKDIDHLLCMGQGLKVCARSIFPPPECAGQNYQPNVITIDTVQHFVSSPGQRFYKDQAEAIAKAVLERGTKVRE